MEVPIDYFSLHIFHIPASIKLDCDAFSTNQSKGDGVNLDVKMTIYDQNGTVIKTINRTDETDAELSFAPPNTGIFYISVEGSSLEVSNGFNDYGSLGCYSLKCTMHKGNSPEFVTQPRSVSIQEGDDATITTTANGSTPLSYAWEKFNSSSNVWNDIGISASSYHITNAELSNSGIYRIRISNNFGTKLSQPFQVKVFDPFSAIFYSWQTFAGRRATNENPDTLTVNNIGFLGPVYATKDHLGNYYISDMSNYVIYKITPTQVITVVAGEISQNRMTTNNPNHLLAPANVTCDTYGNAYFSDGHCIKKIDTSGNVSLFAGSETNNGYLNGNNLDARFDSIGDLEFDTAGNLFVADATKIRKISNGIVSTFAGAETGDIIGNIPDARFGIINSLAITSNNEIYVSMQPGTIRKISNDFVTNYAGGGNIATGDRLDISINGCKDMQVNSTGDLYFSDAYGLRKIATNTGIVTAATGFPINTNPGAQSGIEGIHYSKHIDINSIIEIDNERVIYATPATITTTENSGSDSILYGTEPIYASYRNGTANEARFISPSGLELYNDHLYVVDGGQLIRKIDQNGNVTTLTGQHQDTPTPIDGTPATSAFAGISDLCFQGTHFYTIDTDFNTASRNLRKISLGGVVNTVVLLPTYLDSNGSPVLTGNVITPYQGGLLTSNKYNNIFNISLNGEAVLYAGHLDEYGYINANLQSSRFYKPYGIVHSTIENCIYVADAANSAIRRIDSLGNVTTHTGDPGDTGHIDGTLASARFFYPLSLTIDPKGHLYVSDQGGSVVRKILSNGQIVTIAGNTNNNYRFYGDRDGINTASGFTSIGDIEIDSKGNVFISDTGSNRIVIGRPLQSSDDGGLTTVISDNENDSDNDGQPDLSEILSGTDPYDSGSALKIESASFGTVGPNKTVTLSFPAVQGIIYQIEHSADLQNWTVVEDLITPTNGVNVINKTITLPPGTKGFVRVAVQEL